MFGKTLALMIRSIREDTRLLLAHLFRLFLLLFVFWFLIITQSESRWIGAPGLKFFEMVTYLNFCFITLGGVGYFATTITEEKEEMTLGLLKMADIGPLTLLLGKSMPRLIAAVLLISAQFPFTLLAITLGGVTMHQVMVC